MFGITSFLFALAVLFAVFEIESEGEHGWAHKFPTWRRHRGFVAKTYFKVTKKILTGYHSALFGASALIFIWPMVATDSFTLANTLRYLGWFAAWVIVWDFSWFVLNPHYGMGKFRRQNIWWLSQEPWLFHRIPLGYVVAWAFSIGLAALGGWVDQDMAGYLVPHLQQLLFYLGWLAVLILLGAKAFKRFHAFMRRGQKETGPGHFHQ